MSHQFVDHVIVKELSDDACIDRLALHDESLEFAFDFLQDAHLIGPGLAVIAVVREDLLGFILRVGDLEDHKVVVH